MTQPNILWITYEDTSPQFVSCYGMTPVTTTPNIDQLASEGTIFNNAYASAPVCSASRTALITGVCNESTGLGHHRSKYPIPRDLIKGFPYYMKKNGYYTTNNNKTDYNIIDEKDFIDETWNESNKQAHWRNRDNNQPFFSVFNFNESHQSYTMTNPYKWYEENVLDLLEEDEIVQPDQVQLPPFYRESDEMKKHLSRVYNSLKLCDKKIGHIIDQLKEDDLFDNTIIFCFADHGEGIPRGKCNGIGFGYRASFVAHIPKKYQHLNPWAEQKVSNELLSFEDLAPTLLSITGIQPPDYMTGRILMGNHRETEPEFIYASRNRLDETPDHCRSVISRDYVYTRNFHPHLPVLKFQKYGDVGEVQQAIRKDFANGKLNETQAELVKSNRPLETLFCLSDDPWEVSNLAEDSNKKNVLNTMKNALNDHILSSADVMFLPEYNMITKNNNVAHYLLRAKEEYNPLAEMLEVAKLVNPNGLNLEKQINFMDSKKYQTRYWAAVGIFAARSHLTTSSKLLNYFQKEEEHTVKIELAAALYSIQRDDLTKNYLAELLNSDESLLAQQTFQKLIYAPEIAQDFKEIVQNVRGDLTEKKQSLSSRISHSIDVYDWMYNQKSLSYDNFNNYLSEKNLETFPEGYWEQQKRF